MVLQLWWPVLKKPKENCEVQKYNSYTRVFHVKNVNNKLLTRVKIQMVTKWKLWTVSMENLNMKDSWNIRFQLRLSKYRSIKPVLQWTLLMGMMKFHKSTIHSCSAWKLLANGRKGLDNNHYFLNKQKGTTLYRW